MVIAYIRSDKNFSPAHEQLQLINSYAMANNLVIDNELIDYTSQNKRLYERSEVTRAFQSTSDATLLISDVWVLTTNMEDLIQMFSCLLKHDFKVHFIKQAVIMTQQSSAMLVLGLMDQLRQKLQSESKRVIGRPKGSRSNSKFDVYINDIMAFIKDGKNVSEMARILNVSRSSLKDYIESRELKQVVLGSLFQDANIDAEEQVINTITCPNPK
jgi:DNA invertase Pin-like site-specific DNA recombinase